jgi:recombinational DNA repair protein RecT
MLINKAHVKKYALEISLAKRSGKFKRVSAEFLERVEFKLREYVRREIEMAPSVGVTLK